MKRIVFSVVAIAFISSVLPSCKKCYTCAYYATATQIYCTKDNSAAQLSQYEVVCKQSGGVWSVYQQ